MAKFCLTKQTIDKFKKALKDREIDPLKLAGMTSLERRTFLEKYVGKENAVNTNALFESKLLLKNQKAGFITWAKKITGITPEVKRDLITKIERLDNVLNPKDEQSFLEDLISTRLGVEPTMEEAKTISEISTKLSELRKSFDPKKEEWTSQKDADLYGATQVALEKYVTELKEGKFTLKRMLGDRASQFKTEFEGNKVRATGKLILDLAKTIADTSVSIVASFDDSLFGRQGIMTLLSGHPVIWGRNFLKSFVDIAKTFGGQKTSEALLAKIYSDPLFMNGEYKKAGIIDVTEEQFPTSIPERIPIFGKFFEASEAAFKNGSLRMRTELYTLLRNIKVSRGIELTPEQIKGTGTIVNSLLAKGQLGRTGQNPIVRLLMWAPKMLKADIDILTAHAFDDIPKADRGTALGNLTKIILASLIITMITKANKKDVELDPRSSDFLKPDGKFGYLRGIPQIITLFTRLLTGEYKNNKGEIIKYEPGFGKMSRLDALYSFIRGKAPPATGAVYDYLAGQDFKGNPPTFTSTLLGKGVPISLQNLLQFSKDPSVDNAFGVIADFFGLNSNITPDANIKSGIVPTGKSQKSQDIIDVLSIYAKAMNTDPETAFNRFFSGQRILKVENGAIIVERMSLGDSQAYKKKYGANTKQMKLDHTIPLELGGGNDTGNLKLVSTSDWSSYTKVENALGSALKKGKLSKNEAQSQIKKFKSITNAKERKTYGENLINKYK